MGYSVRYTNRKGKTETVSANSFRQARAIGLSWSKEGSFKIYEDGQLDTIYVKGEDLTERED